ncbi:hypothetical protein U9M48_007393 [Paspalum notatum var. saurae]|uniref:Myb/SANT-like domain-containing protein n=1 Tax=Paspalum notatum var. saurae TaxID=547442 RepID=A0AAQ3Q1M8_PASNO
MYNLSRVFKTDISAVLTVKSGLDPHGLEFRLQDHFETNFVVSQLKDREQRLKKDYNAVKDVVSKSGFGWDNDLKMATTIDGLWDELPSNLRKWKDNSFPFYDDLHEIYNGKIAEGKHCRRSSQKAQKVENKSIEEDHGQMSTPSPSQPVFQGSMVDLLQGGIDLTNDFVDYFDSQYRSMAEEQDARDEQFYNQTQADSIEMQESQKRKFSPTTNASPELQGTREREKKKSKRTENPMNELLALRKEELETYKVLTEKQLQLKEKQIEQNNPVLGQF